MLPQTDRRKPVQQGPTPEMSVWARRLVFLRIILITVILVGILFWLSSRVIAVLLIVLVAALLAYAIVPVIDLLHRVMPRALARSRPWSRCSRAWASLRVRLMPRHGRCSPS